MLDRGWFTRTPSMTGRGWSHAVIVTLVAFSLIAPTAPVRAGSEGCVGPTPQQAVEAIEAYLKPFVTNDVNDALAVPLAPDIRRSNLPPIYPQRLGGPITVRRAEELRSEYVAFPLFYLVTDFGGLRVYVDGCAVSAFFWLNFETSETDTPEAVPPQARKYFRVTSHIVLRAWMDRGLIHELELMQARSEGDRFGTCWPANGDPDEGRTTGCTRLPTTDPLAAVPGCVPGTRDEMTAAARAYIDALQTRDVANVSLAESARRTEMPPAPGKGPVTGTTGDEIRNDIAAGAREEIQAIRNVRWSVVEQDRCHVTVHWLADTTPSGTMHHATRFMVSDDQIHEIEDIVIAPITPGAIEGSCWPKLWSDAEDELYRAVACPAVD